MHRKSTKCVALLAASGLRFLSFVELYPCYVLNVIFNIFVYAFPGIPVFCPFMMGELLAIARQGSFGEIDTRA
jgi:hypothetical protein